MLSDIIIDIFINIWPMLLIFVVIISSIRITYLIVQKQAFVFYKEILALAFIIYILSLFYVVTFQDVSWSTSNFTPLKEMFRYRLGSPLFIRNVIGNLILFMPYGFFVSYILRLDKKYIILLLSLLTSLTIEFTQMAIGRVFDIDDIILNVTGSLLGYILYRFMFVFKEHLPRFLKNQIFYNIVVFLAIFLVALYFAIYLGVITL